MSSTARSVVILGVVLAAFALGIAGTRADDRVAGDRPSCVSAATSPRFDGSGYSHWVRVNNACAYAVGCTISTDVAPQPVSLALAAGEAREINTFLASPASTFRAEVACARR